MVATPHVMKANGSPQRPRPTCTLSASSQTAGPSRGPIRDLGPVLATAATACRSRRPYMRRGGPKGVRVDSFFSGAVAGWSGVSLAERDVSGFHNDPSLLLLKTDPRLGD